MILVPRLTRIIFCLVILISAFTAGCVQSRPVDVEVKNGVINLEHWDFEKNGTVQLNGAWEFYWMRLLSPQDFNLINDSPEYIEVPSTWGHGTSKEFPNTGYATYRMKIDLGSNNEDVLGIRLNPVYTSYKLWINSELCGEVGRVSANQGDFYPKLQTKTVFFKVQPENELVLQVANMEYSRAGLLKGPELGTQEQLLKERDLKLAAELFSTGAILIMAFYHFGLYLYRRKELSTLYFGGFCLLIGTRTLLVGETFFGYLAPGISLNAELHIHSLILYLSPVLFLLFFNSLFPGEISRKVIRPFSVISILGLVVSLLSGTRYYGLVLYIFEFVLVLLICYLIWIQLKILINRREGSAIAAAGTMVLITFTLNDILVDYEIIKTGYITSFGLFIFIFSQSYLLAMKFSKAFTKVEDLSAELEIHNQTLEQNVLERTMDLEQANQQLQEEIAERELAEKALRESEDKYRSIFESTGTAMVIIEEDSTVSLVNTEFEQLSGYTREEVVGIKKWTEFISGDDLQEIQKLFALHKTEPSIHNNYEFTSIDKLGNSKMISATISKVPGTGKYVASLIDMTERKRAEEIIRHMAYHDSLTGLPNRKSFLERFGEELSRAQRNNELLSVMFLDLDNFKYVNDNFGHKTGDLLLSEVAKRVKFVLRASDIVSRFGGDEFIILLTGIKKEDDARLVANKILNVFRDPVLIGNEHFTIKTSIGISFYPKDGEQAEELIKKSDLAMYKAKKESAVNESKFCFYNNDDILCP